MMFKYLKWILNSWVFWVVYKLNIFFWIMIVMCIYKLFFGFLILWCDFVDFFMKLLIEYLELKIWMFGFIIVKFLLFYG